MSNVIRLSVVLLSCAVYSTAVSAQQPLPAAQPDANQIHLNVVVTGKSGKPVAGLEKQDFTVLDNKMAMPIASFEAVSGPQAPVQIILVVDEVNTTYTNLGYERGEIDKFLASNGGHLAYPVSLAVFTDSSTKILQGPTRDGNLVSAALDRSPIALRQINGSTANGGQERVILSLGTLRALASREASIPGRKIIFWVSPGWSLLSGASVNLSFKQLQSIYTQVVVTSNLLRSSDVTLYSIDPQGSSDTIASQLVYQPFVAGAKKPSEIQFGYLALQVLAVQSGGLALSASNDIVSHLQQCMDDTTAYYRLSYDAPPAEKPDEYHKIDIKLSQHNLTARTRTIYYAEPQSGATH